MNYIKEINAFYDWLETNSISDSAIALWHALMHINNKAGWITEFAVAISTLETKTGLKKDAIIRARHRLQQLKRIDFRSRSGQQSAIYTIIPFDCVVLSDTKYITNRNTNRELSATQTASQTATIIKLNETKQDREIDRPSRPNFVDFFEQERAELLSSTNLQRFLDFTTWGMEDQLICEAIRRAKDNNAGHINYIFAILGGWQKKNIKTMTGLTAYEAEQEAQKKGGQANGPPRSGNSEDILSTPSRYRHLAK